MIETDELKGEDSLPLDVETFYGKDGPLAESLSGFEKRSEQIEMATSVSTSLKQGRNLIVEAGTGTGKSLAYLVPLAHFACQTDKPVLVSTHTINLQEQIVQKDLPLVQEATGLDFTYSLAKGRANYVCKKRLEWARRHKLEMFPEPAKQNELNRLIEWANKTQDGSLSDLDHSPDRSVWGRVNASRSNCHCTEPDFQDRCFYRESRERMNNTDIIVVNHYLFMEDLRLRIVADTGYLPDYGAIVLDEAHNFESVAQNSLGYSSSLVQHRRLVSDLYNEEKKSGFLLTIRADDAFDAVTAVKRASERFFDAVRNWHERNGHNGQPVRVETPNFVKDTLTPALNRLHDALRDVLIRKELTGEEEKELNSYANRALDYADTLDYLLKQENKEDVYWVESSDYAGNVTIKSSLIDVSEKLSEHFFSKVHSAILTSATLATGSREPFQFVKKQLGAGEANTLKLGNPFNYRRQVKLYIPGDLPHPGYKEEEYVEGVIRYTRKYVNQTGGNAFVLFTSYSMLGKVADALRDELEENGIHVYEQGKELPRHKMLNRFQSSGSSVIFGTSSFWEGVDVPGESLQNVIITKLPFPNPSDPIVEAVTEHMEENDRDPFKEFYIPRAILKLRQGFGRLIRTRTDTGQVAILDSRILKKSYGNLFLNALPNCEIIRDQLDEVSDPR